MDSIEFVVDGSVNEPLGPEEIEIELQAIGVDFKDMLTVIGQTDGDKFGHEGAGIVTRVGAQCTDLNPGDRVMTAGRDFFRSHARCHHKTAFKLPDSIGFTHAAAMPVVFGTALYALSHIAHLQPGETVLVHSGAGGTGQAGIQIAQLLGAEVFTTVSSKEKKDQLMELYNIPENHIFFSRDTSFADGIMRMTCGKGVDVLLNSLSGENLAASWKCVGPFGRMVDIGKGDIEKYGTLAMKPFSDNKLFAHVDLDLIIAERPLLASKLFQEIMSLLIEKKIKPSNPLEIIPISNLEQALRALQSGKSLGKIVIEVTKTAEVLVSTNFEPLWQAQ